MQLGEDIYEDLGDSIFGANALRHRRVGLDCHPAIEFDDGSN